MKAILEALTAVIRANMPYLSWVGVLDSEMLPPGEPEPPFLGLRDGGIVPTSKPGLKEIEELTVIVVPYQSITLENPGGAVMGSEGQLGDAGIGLLDLSAALKPLLNDNYLNQPGIHFAYRRRVDPSQAIAGPAGSLLSYQRNTFVYRRYVS